MKQCLCAFVVDDECIALLLRIGYCYVVIYICIYINNNKYIINNIIIINIVGFRVMESTRL